MFQTSSNKTHSQTHHGAVNIANNLPRHVVRQVVLDAAVVHYGRGLLGDHSERRIIGDYYRGGKLQRARCVGWRRGGRSVGGSDGCGMSADCSRRAGWRCSDTSRGAGSGGRTGWRRSGGGRASCVDDRGARGAHSADEAVALVVNNCEQQTVVHGR